MDRKRIDSAKSYDIVALAEDLGFTPRRVARNFYTLEEHDSMRMKVSTNTYQWYSTGNYGDTISFVMKLGAEKDARFKSFDYAVSFIERKMQNKPEVKVERKPFERKTEKGDLKLPASDDSCFRIIRYLEERGISRRVISTFLVNRHMYQSKNNGNLVFVSYKDNKPVFITEKSSIIGNRFMKEHSGNDYNQCFYIDHGKDSMIVTEAIIDMMSLITMTDEYHEHNYLSINSVTKDAAIYHHLETNPNIKTVMLRLDHDEAGINATNRIAERIREKFPHVEIDIEYPPSQKDWNDYLVSDYNKDARIKGTSSGLQ